MAMSRSWGRVSGFVWRGGGGCGAQTETGRKREKVGRVGGERYSVSETTKM